MCNMDSTQQKNPPAQQTSPPPAPLAPSPAQQKTLAAPPQPPPAPPQGRQTSQHKRHVRLRLVMGLLIGCVMVALYVMQPALLAQIDRYIYDIFLRYSATDAKERGLTPSPTPAVVDLDENSLARYGQWPWPRHLVALLLKRLTEGGAAAIGLDMLLAEQDRTSPLQLQKSLKHTFDVDVRFEGLPESLTDNDKLLAQIMAQTPSVSGFFLHFMEDTATPVPPDLPLSLGVVEQRPPGTPEIRARILNAYGATLPLSCLRAAAPLGSINVAPDPDGVVRAVPLVAQSADRVHVSLGLRALMRGLGTDTLILVGGPDGLQSLRLGKYTVPVTPQGLMYVPFRGPRHTYPYFSAADVLDGLVPPEEIQGRVFIVGTSAPGLLDIRATPLDSVYPGVEVHTAVIDAVLSGRHMQIPAWIPGAQVLGIALTCVGATLAFALAAPAVYFPLALALSTGSVWATWRIFERGYFFSPQYMLLTVVLLAMSLLVVRFWQENQQRRQLRQAFSRYVAPGLVDRISERGGDVLAGEQREVTLMFTDIRSFTSISEKLAPAQVVAMLNRYFTPMTAIIRASSGTVDKFIGDAIMAFWNAPLDVPDHSLHGVRSALAMHTALQKLNVELEPEMGIALRMGVGLHTGLVYVGNMGSAELLDYTCIGDTVNLASRLEGMCPVYGVGIVLSGDCVQHCRSRDSSAAIFCRESWQENRMPPELVFVPLDSIRVKGKDVPVTIYTVLTGAEAVARDEELQDFRSARLLYEKGDFRAAGEIFKALRDKYNHAVLYSMYAERCQTLAAAPPKPWDGVWTHSQK